MDIIIIVNGTISKQIIPLIMTLHDSSVSHSPEFPFFSIVSSPSFEVFTSANPSHAIPVIIDADRGGCGHDISDDKNSQDFATLSTKKQPNLTELSDTV